MTDTTRVTNRQILEHLENALPALAQMGRMSQSVDTLATAQRETTEELRKQGSVLAGVRAKIENGIFLRRSQVEEVVEKHIARCPGADLESRLRAERDNTEKRRREGWRDSVSLVGLLIRSVSMGVAVVGAIKVARELGWM